MTIDDLRDRIAELMKWTRQDVDKFSLPQLQAFVRGKDEKLDRILADVIDSKLHWLVKQ